ncbi:MAG: hypothetical protein M1543_04505 [Firmicutes bacterium]|nr:hypothetical protein [Bacillota bacterium]
MKNKLVFSIGIVAIIITGLFTGWMAFSGHSKTQAKCTLNVPEKIAAFSRTEFISGPEAIKQIAMMHGKEIQLDEGHIAKYQGDGKEITLWISVSPSREEGEKLFRLMDEKIPASQVFKNRQELQISNRKVIKVDGMGQEHYYWVSGEYNYWVAVAGGDGKSIVSELMSKVE